MKKIGIVIPSIREDNLNKFLKAWDSQINNDYTNVYIIEDNPEKTFKLNTTIKNIAHVSWKEIEGYLEEKSWIISRRNSGIRCFGFLLAYNDGCEYIITLDDDCFPIDNKEIMNHIDNLRAGIYEEIVVSSCKEAINNYQIRVRGLPYSKLGIYKSCMLSHGIWTGNLDLDGVSSLYNQCDYNAIGNNIENKYFPMCWMNLAFDAKIVPIMYCPLNGLYQPFNRWEDIWCGYIAQKILHHLQYGINNGNPIIYHSRASNKYKNLIAEASGYEINETFWKEVDKIILTHDNLIDCYLEISDKLNIQGDYWDCFKKTMKIWISLFK